MKNTIKKLLSTIVVISSMILCICPLQTTAAAKVDLSALFQKHSYEQGFHVAAVRLGVKEKKNSKFPTYYAKGKSLVFGVDEDSEPGVPNDPYVYLKNTGNKRLVFQGVKIGDSLKKAKKAIKKRYGYKLPRGKYAYCFGQAGEFTLKVKNGKVAGYTYRLCFTG